MVFQVGRLVVSGFDGTTLNKDLKTLISKYQISGVILFSRNIESIDQLTALNKEILNYAKRPLLISVDQEGGLVARIRSPFTIIPPMSKVGDYVKKTQDFNLVKKLGSLMAKELQSVGINFDYAPVVDVHSNPSNPIIGSRSFSPNPKLVSLCADYLIQGFDQEGVLTCAKHFPGHGSTNQDSHLTLPIVDNSMRLLWRRDLVPYLELIQKNRIRSLMTAHVLYPDLDQENPATLSSVILTDLLKNRLGFKGLIISDDLFMKAVYQNNSLDQSALAFFQAGGDLALFCQNPAEQMEAMEKLELIFKKDQKLLMHLNNSLQKIQKTLRFLFAKKNLVEFNQIDHLSHRKIIEKILH